MKIIKMLIRQFINEVLKGGNSMLTIKVTSDTFEQVQNSKAYFEINVLEPEQLKGNEDFILENIDTGKTLTGKMLMRKMED